jgi:tight adherence protein B
VTRVVSRRLRRWPPRLASLTFIAVAVTLLAAPHARAQSLQATLVGAVPFPSRTLVISVPQSIPVSARQIHVTENGELVRRFTANSLKQAGAGDLGIVVVIDSDPSMSGVPLTQAMAAARALAAQRTGNQQLGAIFGDGSNLPLTTNQQTINTFLAHQPRIVPRTNLLSATQAAISELKAANVLSGAVIYVSDDIDKAPGLSVASLAALANAAHIRIFTVAIHDRATYAPGPYDLPLTAMGQLATSAGGSFAEAVPVQLRNTFTAIEAGLTSQYVVHYQSRQRYGEHVSVVVSVAGVPGTFTTAYASPPAPRGAAQPTHHKSFWASTLALVLVALGCAALFGVAVAIVLSTMARSGELRSRVHAFVPPARQTGPPVTHGSVSIELGSFSEQLLERRRWWPAFVQQVDVSGMSRSATELAYFAVLGSLLTALLLELVTGSVLLAILGLATGPLVVRALVKRSVRKNQRRFQEQLPGQLHEIAGAMRTGRSIAEAFAVVAASADEPMRRELQRALVDERAGLQLEEAIRPIGDRMASSEIEQVAVVAALHRRTGANITEVLDRMADSARERVEIRRELLTLTAQARLSRTVLTALPIFVVIAIDLIGHTYERPLFHTTAGLVVLALAAVMVALGSWVMKKMVEIEE